MTRILKDKDFYRTMLSIALPVTLQNLISSSLNMIDTFMITGLGEASIAAVGQANQVFFLFSILLFGINSGASIFIAQFWGKRDASNIRRVLGLGIIIGSIVGLIFTIAALVFPRTIMRILINDPEVIELGVKYLRVVCISYIFTSITFAYSGACRSVRQARLPMVVSGLSIIVNTVLNYCLIFGKFGFPQLGVSGAALATVIARVVEALTIIFIIYRDGSRNVLAAKIKEMTDISIGFVKKFLKTISPVILNEGLWSLGLVMYSIAYAKIGKEATAAVQIATTIQNIFMVLSLGLAGACATMIGNKIGANEEEEGISYAKKFCIIGIITGTILGILLYVSAPFILKLFSNISPELFETAKKIIRVIAFYIPSKLYTSILVVGIFRGGGDTKYSMILEAGCVWIVGVPLAFLGALVLKLPVHWVVALAYSEEAVKTILGTPRALSNKWIKNLVDDI
ncbi:multidrug resistance protein [Gottschalkia purinilytica]|uniref:Multidrug resistance protein n=1 Tax=Gottschalkia purinilytica TaxID=1503 RepID=A0A0L0WAM5_GOTPU|nr:multidrug resistance protein [Gottschalkia purinilytica]